MKLITILYSLAYECPRKNRMKDCQLQQFEHLSFYMKVKAIDDLAAEKRESLYLFHNSCSGRNC